jgi:hypothetical protein
MPDIHIHDVDTNAMCTAVAYVFAVMTWVLLAAKQPRGDTMSKPKDKNKRRNPISAAHSLRGAAGAGIHKDRKREASRKACRNFKHKTNEE